MRSNVSEKTLVDCMDRRSILYLAVGASVLTGCEEQDVKNEGEIRSDTMKRSPNGFTTRPSPVDIESNYPELAPLRRTAVRLHPRKKSDLPVDSSKIGGVFFANDPAEWPFCRTHKTHHIGILQLTKYDVPELGFPDGCDIFQLTFCPFDHDDVYCPDVSGRWLSLSDDHIQQSSNPSFEEPEYKYIPNECAIHPERVEDYPHMDELPEDLQARIGADRSLVGPVEEWLERPDDEWAPETAYSYFLSAADGTKVGGNVNWIQVPQSSRCPKCSGWTEDLLTIASWEWDGGTFHRWKPIEDCPQGVAVSSDGADDHGMMFGDAGAIYVGVCRKCEGFPIARTFQCS